MGIKPTGFDALGAALHRAAASLEASVVAAELEVTGQEIRDAMRARVPRASGLTQEDISAQVVDRPAEGLRLEVGANRGAGGRAFILNFLEFGTRKQPPRPIVRPTLDTEVPGALGRFYSRLGARVRAAMGGR